MRPSPPTARHMALPIAALFVLLTLGCSNTTEATAATDTAVAPSASASPGSSTAPSSARANDEANRDIKVTSAEIEPILAIAQKGDANSAECLTPLVARTGKEIPLVEVADCLSVPLLMIVAQLAPPDSDLACIQGRFDARSTSDADQIQRDLVDYVLQADSLSEEELRDLGNLVKSCAA